VLPPALTRNSINNIALHLCPGKLQNNITSLNEKDQVYSGNYLLFSFRQPGKYSGADIWFYTISPQRFSG
jgi:hypothetical protein